MCRPGRNARRHYNKLDQNGKSSLDYDIILSTTIDVPHTNGRPKDESLNETRNCRIKKVAHVKAYAPRTFRILRSWFGITEKDFIESFVEKGPFVSFQSNSKGAARVGKW